MVWAKWQAVPPAFQCLRTGLVYVPAKTEGPSSSSQSQAWLPPYTLMKGKPALDSKPLGRGDRTVSVRQLQAGLKLPVFRGAMRRSESHPMLPALSPSGLSHIRLEPSFPATHRAYRDSTNEKRFSQYQNFSPGRTLKTPRLTKRRVLVGPLQGAITRN